MQFSFDTKLNFIHRKIEAGAPFIELFEIFFDFFDKIF